jgi:hypothetical protein
MYDKIFLNFIEAVNYKHALWVAEESYVFSKTLFGDTHLEKSKTLNNLRRVFANIAGHYARVKKYPRAQFLSAGFADRTGLMK